MLKASLPVAFCRNTDHLTLLTGPGLLSPARGAGVPAPIAAANSAQLRFTPDDSRSRLAAPPILLRRTGAGTLTLSSDPSAIPPVSTLRKGSAAPSPDALRFKSTLEKIPASLRLQSPTTLRRD